MNKNGSISGDFLKTLCHPSPLQRIFLVDSDLEIQIKRDDLIHPVVSGNKIRKLKAYLDHYANGNYKGIISKGGLNSNHLHALGFVCRKLSIPFQFLIYGTHSGSNSFVLKDFLRWGISGSHIPRSFSDTDWEFYMNKFEDWLYIPEGGLGQLSSVGVADLAAELPQEFDQRGNVFALACGTGATLLGLSSCFQNAEIKWMSPVKSFSLRTTEITHFHSQLNDRLRLPFAGYSVELMNYIDRFFQINGVWLDPIYTSRLFYSLDLHLQHLPFLGNVVALHSGGLQAWRQYLVRYPDAIKHLDFKALELELVKIEECVAGAIN